MKMTNEADVTAIEEQKGSVAMALVVPYLNEYRKLRRRRFYSGWGIIASFFPLVACAWVLGMPLGGAIVIVGVALLIPSIVWAAMYESIDPEEVQQKIRELEYNLKM